MSLFDSGGERPTVPGVIAGRLLISTPVIGDGNFDHTVVLMLGHTNEGALGVTLNRPLEMTVEEALPQWHDLSSRPERMFSGGPVESTMLVGVAGSEVGGEYFAAVPGPLDCWTLDLDQDPALAATHVTALRIFAGYAGWGAGQLEGEIRAGAWFVADALHTDVFAADPEGLWETVLRRQPNSSRWFSQYPDDPSVN